MNVIKEGSVYRIYGDDLTVLKKLPASTYRVCFSEMSGFFLTRVDDMETKEEKIYGKANELVDVVFETFTKVNRNLGVLASGQKGTGKSLFMRQLAEKSISEGIPVILITEAFDGVTDFLEKIEDASMVVFDEFEKVYRKKEEQETLLGMLDGISSKKRLFVFTINEIYQLSSYFLDRPGRVHYHITFGQPKEEEIRQYLQDNVKEQYWQEIDSVIEFARDINLTYDCLRAIALEFNLGRSFNEFIDLLNISPSAYADFSMRFVFEGVDQDVIIPSISVFKNEKNQKVKASWESCFGYLGFTVIFNIKDIKYDINNKKYFIAPNDLLVRFKGMPEEMSNDKKKIWLEERGLFDFNSELKEVWIEKPILC